MLCENCGGKVKPIVAVDIDGTLGDYHTHFIDFACMYMREDYPRDYDGSVEFSEFLGLDKETYRTIKLAYRQGGMKRSMPLNPGARGLISRLNLIRDEVEIWVTTTRPYLRLDGIDPDTRFWLDSNKLGYHNLLYHEDKYRLLAERCDPGRVVMVLDDLDSQCQAAQNEFGWGVAVQLATPYNSGAPHGVRVSMMDVPSLLATRLAEWNKVYA